MVPGIALRAALAREARQRLRDDRRVTSRQPRLRASTHARTVSSGVSASGVGDVVGEDAVSVGLGVEEDGVGSGMLGVGSSSQPRADTNHQHHRDERATSATCTSFPEKAERVETTQLPHPAENAPARICG